MSTILIIDESPLFRRYLSQKLRAYGFDVIEGANGLDGWVKMRSEMPDLVIMDYFLSRKSSQEVLQEKKDNRNTDPIPLIMVASKIDKRKVVELAGFNVKKIISKPVRMERLLNTVADILGVDLKVDDTPCVIEAHFNEDILFIEISRGLNIEKIEQLQYKIAELLELYQVRKPKVLIMMAGLELPDEHRSKLIMLLEKVTESAQSSRKLIKILTNNENAKRWIADSEEFSEIEVFDSLDNAMDSMLGLRADDIAKDEVARERLLKSTAPKKEGDETIQMRFDDEELRHEDQQRTSVFNSEAHVAVVDDDVVIQELLTTVFSETAWKLHVFSNGREFLDGMKEQTFDLVFLDLMMPEINGFQVLQQLSKESDETPVIVFSALSKKETVIKAVGYGIKSYMIKPLKPEQLMKKAEEVLNTSF
jgi:DNA-binding response OmpR family regulator